MGNKKRGQPADPQAIMLRRARERHAERQRDRNPEEWGVSAEILVLDVHRQDVSAKIGERKRIIHANRSSAFDLLHQAKGLDDAEHRASKRYFKDWCARAGVQTSDEAPIMTPIDATNDGQGLSQRMIDAGRRIDLVHRGGRIDIGTAHERPVAGIGVAAARLLQALVEPVVMRGEVRPWRAIAQQVTGETEKHAQGAAVRMATASLLAHYNEVDGVAQPQDDVNQRNSPIRIWRSSE